MPRTRVFMMGMSPMLRDLVRALIAREPTLELVGESRISDLQGAMETNPDVVVTCGEDVTEAEVVGLLRAACRIRVIGVSADGGSGSLYEMRPRRKPLGELGVRSLAALLSGEQDPP
jgi:hypothetical protein